jgi:hypothetical protein
MEEYCRAGQAKDDNAIGRKRIECWISKATNTYSEYVLLVAFARQKWLRERA